MSGCQTNEQADMDSERSFSYITNKTGLEDSHEEKVWDEYYVFNVNVIDPNNIGSIEDTVIGVDGEFLSGENIKKLLADKLNDGAEIVIIDENMHVEDVYDYFGLTYSGSVDYSTTNNSSLNNLGVAIFKDLDGKYTAESNDGYVGIDLNSELLDDNAILDMLSDITITKGLTKPLATETP